MGLEYHEIFPLERAELEKLMNSGNEQAISDALLSAALYDPDWKWVQEISLRHLDHPNESVRWNAVTCFGHIARIHRRLDTGIVVPRLTMMLESDPRIAPNIEDTLDDIKWFLRVQ